MGLYYRRPNFNSNSDDGGGEIVLIDIERSKNLQSPIGVT